MQPKNLTKQSRCNPQSSTSIIIPQIPFQRHDKPHQSHLPIPKSPNNKDTLQTRYLTLQQNYKNLQQKLKQRIPLILQQNHQLQRLQNTHENNIKEINKLRGMLGFLQKINQTTQTIPIQTADDIQQLKNNKNKAKTFNYPQKVQNPSIKKPHQNKPPRKKYSDLQNLHTQPIISNTSYHKNSQQNLSIKFYQNNQPNKSHKQFMNTNTNTQFNLSLTPSKNKQLYSHSLQKNHKFKFVPTLHIY